MALPDHTRDGVLPSAGMTLYRVWNGVVETIKVLDFNLLPGATIRTIEYKDKTRKARASADMFYASLSEAWKAERADALKCLSNTNKEISDLLDTQKFALEVIAKADEFLTSDIAKLDSMLFVYTLVTERDICKLTVTAIARSLQTAVTYANGEVGQELEWRCVSSKPVTVSGVVSYLQA